jgi:hypothetical protein
MVVLSLTDAKKTYFSTHINTAYMKTKFLFLSLLSTIYFFTSCTKELSHENAGIPSEGSLQSDVTGDCLPKNVNGVYEAGKALTATNFIEVQVNVTKSGSYTITSDTLNGIYFRATGVFTSTGMTTISLKGNGTPVAAGVNTYTISYAGTVCTVAVTTLPAGAGGPAEFTMAGAPATCTSFNLSGTYTQGVALTGSGNNVVLNVNVTKIGTYDITTTASNGITFKGTGALLSLGTATITLTAQGTPVATGTTNIAVTIGASTCSFPVQVAGPATYTIDCASAFVDGDYEEGVALNASTNTIDIDVNVTVAGGYSITGTVNGMTFKDDGVFTSTGVQTITLEGSGTPAADGDFDLPLNGTTGSCTVEITVDPGAAAPDMKWTLVQGATNLEGPTMGAIVLPLGGMESMGISGESTSGDISLALTLTKTGTMSTGTFSTSSTTNIATLLVVNTATATTMYSGIMGMGNLTVNLTTYDVTTKVAQGTFSGTVFNASNQTVSITGTFKAEIL